MREKFRLRTIVFVMIFITAAHSLISQNKFEQKLKFSLFNALNPHMPHLTLGYELIFKEKIGVEFDYGRRYLDKGIYWYLINEKYFDSIVSPSFGERIHFEIKYYKSFNFYSKNQNFSERIYCGLALYRIIDRRNILISYRIPTSSNSTTFNVSRENTAIQKQLLISDFIFGIESKKKRFSVDVYALVGVKHKRQYFIANESEEKGYYAYLLNFWDQPMDAYRLSLNCGVRLGYDIFNARKKTSPETQ